MGDIRSVRGDFVGGAGEESCCTTTLAACDYPQLRIKQVGSVVWQAWPESLCVAQSGCREQKQGRDMGRTGSGHERERMVRGGWEGWVGFSGFLNVHLLGPSHCCCCCSPFVYISAQDGE